MFRDAEVAMADMYAGKCSDAQAKELDAAFWDELDERIEHGREVYGGEGGACETHGSEEKGGSEEVRGRPWRSGVEQDAGGRGLEREISRPSPQHPFSLACTPTPSRRLHRDLHRHGTFTTLIAIFLPAIQTVLEVRALLDDTPHHQPRS
jgi:hypothetical protein